MWAFITFRRGSVRRRPQKGQVGKSEEKMKGSNNVQRALYLVGLAPYWKTDVNPVDSRSSAVCTAAARRERNVEG